MRFFDASLRAGLRSDADFDNLAYFGLCGALFVGPRGARADSADQVIRRFEQTAGRARVYGSLHRVPVGVALGMIADSAPRRAHPEVMTDLEERAAAGELAAIGPIQWPDDSGTAEWQLELAEAHGLRVLVELPQRTGSAPIDSLVTAARSAGLDPSLLVIVGVDFTSFRAVTERDLYWIADLSPAGLGWEAAADLVERHGTAPCRRMMLSASAHSSFDVLAAARFAERLLVGELNPQSVDGILFENALHAFSLR